MMNKKTNNVLMGLSYMAPVAINVNPEAGNAVTCLMEEEHKHAYRFERRDQKKTMSFTPAHV